MLVICLSATSLSLCAQQVKKEKGTAAAESPTIEMYVVNHVLHIKNAPAGAKLQIITIVGNKVCEINVQSPDASYELYELNLPRAIYIFKLEGLVRKFVIK